MDPMEDDALRQSGRIGVGHPIKRSTTRLRNRVVALWNKGLTQEEVGQALGISRGAVGRLITEARRMDVPTVHYTRSEGAQRQAASQRQRLGEDGFYRRMAQIRATRHKDTPAEPSGE